MEVEAIIIILFIIILAIWSLLFLRRMKSAKEVADIIQGKIDEAEEVKKTLRDINK